MPKIREKGGRAPGAGRPPAMPKIREKGGRAPGAGRPARNAGNPKSGSGIPGAGKKQQNPGKQPYLLPVNFEMQQNSDILLGLLLRTDRECTNTDGKMLGLVPGNNKSENIRLGLVQPKKRIHTKTKDKREICCWNRRRRKCPQNKCAKMFLYARHFVSASFNLTKFVLLDLPCPRHRNRMGAHSRSIT